MKFAAQEFIRDFIDETGEHIQRINHNLIALEADQDAGGTAETRVALVDDLFRSFHTLKGLCGMVGLVSAADLSHSMESILLSIKRNRMEVTSELVDRLLDGTRALEGGISTAGDPGKHQPDVTAILSALNALLTEDPPAAHPAPAASVPEKEAALPALAYSLKLPTEIGSNLKLSDWRKLETAAKNGQNLTLAVFSPSPEKAERGLNVNAVREKLESAAELLKALPLIAGTDVRFVFITASSAPLRTEQFADLELTALAVPESESAAAQPDARVVRSLTSSVRVDITRLDEIMRLVSDLVVSRSRLAAVLPRLKGAAKDAIKGVEESSEQIERQLRFLREAVMHARMVPLAEAFSRMPLVVRDLARSSGKQVALELIGETTEIDKALVERLVDPLLHLVRNSIAHGIEMPAERLKAGKPGRGKLVLSGEPQGDHILITIRDDGRGVDLDKISARAYQLGLLSEKRPISAEEGLGFICRPGFSTKTEVDMGSGRGVGMDVVQQAVKAVGGSLAMATRPGQGSTFNLRLPLTLAIIEAFIVVIGDQKYAVPQTAVNRAIEIDKDGIIAQEGQELIPLDGEALPLVRLESLFGLTTSGDVSAHNGHGMYGLITGENGGRAALVVDRVIGLREIVVRTISDDLVAQPGIAGATELGDGSIILIFDVPDMLRFARQFNKTKSVESK